MIGYGGTRYLADPLILFRIFHYPVPPAERAEQLWFTGTYGEYLVRRVSKVFPELHGDVLRSS